MSCTLFNDEDAGENFEGLNVNKAMAKVAALLHYANWIQSGTGIDFDKEDIVTWLNCDDDATSYSFRDNWGRFTP